MGPSEADATYRVQRGDKARPAPGSAPVGLALFLVSLGVLFVSSLVGYLYVRLQAEAWPPAGTPPPPGTLWLSTLVLLLSSGTVHLALRAARQGRQARLQGALLATLFLGLSFLGLQAVNWSELISANVTADADLYGYTFFLLTGLHALHLLGGLVPLALTTARAGRGAYGPESHEGVLLCAMYWHFLDLVWVVLFLVLVVFG